MIQAEEITMTIEHALAPSRPDLITARIVEEAIALEASHGKNHAASFLTKHAVHFAVIVRVLSEPGHRRKGAEDMAM